MENGAGKSSETASAQSDPAPVFISYASQDAEIANTVCTSLESHGVPCWMAPRDVKPGAPYADAIVRAITEAKALILVMSASAVGSPHVAREVERAASKRKPIIPFRIDMAALNPELEYFLSNSQWIDVPALGMKAALAKLAEATASVSTPPAPRPAQPTPGHRVTRRMRIVIAAAILIALGAALALGLRSWQGSRLSRPSAASVIADKSIAVLPFVDMSEKKDQEYFGDGMAEEIIDLLVKDPGFKVIGRTSSFQFKGKSTDLRSIGNQLGVAYVLEGSVRKVGDRLRVTAQLIDCKDGSHLWSQIYDRDLIDVLKMQDEIAVSVARALHTEVYGRYLVSRPALRNAEAYTLYLKALHAYEYANQQNWERIVSNLEQALELDPTFWEAERELADANLKGGMGGFLPSDIASERARNAAERAIKLNPKSPCSHAILGEILYVYDWDWAAAEREIALSLALEPNNTCAVGTASRLSLIMGRWDDALKRMDALVELDPLDPAGYFWLAILQLRRGQLPEAEAAIRRALEIDPTLIFGRYTLGQVLLARGQSEAALAAMQMETSEMGRLTGSSMGYFALKRRSESDTSLAQLLKSNTYLPSGNAAVYAFRGESDEAFKWLDRAYAEKDSLLNRIKYSPDFDNLHGDPRYKAFLKKMNLPE
jgi:TolB-like protein/predicted Zn-dependent protease